MASSGVDSLDVFWSFRSPYCYLALDRIFEIKQEFDIEVNVRPVWPLAIREPKFFANTDPNHFYYHALDSERVARYLGISYRRPVPDPIVQNMTTGQISQEQPYIFRLTRLGVVAVVEGQGLAFVNEVSRLLWDGTVDGWNQGTYIASAIARAGLEPGRVEEEIVSNASRYDTIIESNQEALESIGHWGVPTFAFDDEPFFGQDRINMLRWRMKHKGVPKKPQERSL